MSAYRLSDTSEANSISELRGATDRAIVHLRHNVALAQARVFGGRFSNDFRDLCPFGASAVGSGMHILQGNVNSAALDTRFLDPRTRPGLDEISSSCVRALTATAQFT